MIPQSAIDYWKTVAPWGSDLQVEQDLVISRAVTEVFSDEALRNLVAIRGGTVLNKIYFGGGSRYSEDIDLVQVRPGVPDRFTITFARGWIPGWVNQKQLEVTGASSSYIGFSRKWNLLFPCD